MILPSFLIWYPHALDNMKVGFLGKKVQFSSFSHDLPYNRQGLYEFKLEMHVFCATTYDNVKAIRLYPSLIIKFSWSFQLKIMIFQGSATNGKLSHDGLEIRITYFS